MTGWD